MVLLVLSETALGGTRRLRDARLGVLDATLVVIVRQQAADEFQIEETFWGDKKRGDSLQLPGFRLFTVPEDGPDIVEPISTGTRILLFLRPASAEASRWEITDYGHCFFWVQEPGRIFELRNTALQAVAMRRRWEEAASVPDPLRRVEALWPFLRLREYGTSFLEHTKLELRKIGPVAGDYFAEQFDAMSHDDRSELYYESGSYGSEKLHQRMILQLKTQQRAYEGFLAVHGLDGKAFLQNWNSVPQDVRDAYHEIPSLLYGLASISNRADLPLIREVAVWAVENKVDQAREMTLMNFRVMPDRENLPGIDAIWKDAEQHEGQDKEIILHDVIGALCAHRFPETVPLLAPFVTHPYAGPEVEDALTQIVGKDLGRNPNSWVDWYQARKPRE